jgi:protein-disulfide isomerase
MHDEPRPAASDESPPLSAEPVASPAPAEDAAPPADTLAPRRPAPPRSGPSPLLTLALGALLIAAGFGGGFLVGRESAPGRPVPTQAAGEGSPGPTTATATPSALEGLPAEGRRLGRADAPVTIEVWADYQCPFCARFAQETVPLLADWIADGTVAILHRDYAFLGPESFDAAVAARCAGREDRFLEMHDALYAVQQGENQGSLSRSRLEGVAAAIGLDSDAFAACMDDRSELIAVLDETAAGVRAGVNSTPTIDIDGRRFRGVAQAPELRAAIDEALAATSPVPLPSPDAIPDPWDALATDGRTAGDPAAEVTVELWMDYQSTDSVTYVNEVEPLLRDRAAAGDVRLVRRDLAALDEESVAAAAAVRCVEQQAGPAWLVHSILSVSSQGPGAGIYVPDNLLRLAARLGLDVVAFDACLADPATTALVREETAEGTAAGIESGPAILIRLADGTVLPVEDPLDPDAVEAALDRALGDNAGG